ncbi:MAG: RNA-directed DNA polymerase, partial [Ignavibacteriaceae bacterium]|nr:RNA-directed DNA polymerase [Ignavibacteriaceae bacterium]
NELDRFCKEELKIKKYVRYMDDFVVLAGERAYLESCLLAIKGFLEDELRLCLNEKTYIGEFKNGLDFLGYRQYTFYRIMKKRNSRKNIRKFRKFKRLVLAREMNEADAIISYKSFLGFAKWCRSNRLSKRIKNIMEEICTC